jgi:hypothetical protein
MADDKYDKARDLADKALEEFVEGHDEEATRLGEQAKATDPQAVEDRLRELDPEASKKDPATIKEDLGNDADKP